MPSPPRIHYVTVSGDPPNGGVPPGVMFSAPPGFAAPRPDMPWTPATSAPPPYQAVASPPPAPPAYYERPFCQPVAYEPIPVFYPVPTFTPPPTPSSPPADDHFVPPGSTLNGVAPDLDGYGYIFPSDDVHTTIMWVKPPTRPCDKPNQLFEMSRYKVPTSLKVEDLIEQFGGSGDKDGITEIYELGNGRWAEGMTYKKDGRFKDKVLKEIGWTKRRGEGNPVFLCCKKG